MNATLQKLSENFGAGVLHDAPVLGAELARKGEEYNDMNAMQRENTAAVYACALLLSGLRDAGLLTSDDFTDGKLTDALFALNESVTKN